MTYLAHDLSVQGGSPAYLFKFNYTSVSWRFCTLDGGVTSYVHLAEDYTPTSITRSKIDITEEMPRSNVDITVPKTNPLALLFIAGPPEGVITTTIYRLHLGDADQEYIVEFKGRVLSCSFDDENGTAMLTCEPIFTSLRRPGILKTYDPQCVHALYMGGCRLRKEDWQIPASVLDVTGTQVIVQQAGNYPDNHFKGGPFECGAVKRVISEHAGVVLTLMHPVPQSLIGQPCKIAPGCDHTRGDDGCSKFKTIDQPQGNGINYGGEPWLPEKNPFTGDSIFW